MKKILLTSAGFENVVIEQKLLKFLEKNAHKAKVVWIPTAANSPEAQAVLPKCMGDLICAGIESNNILTYNLDYVMDRKELSEYDAVYVCGGDSRYLLNKMNEMHFTKIIKDYVNNGGIYIGVSAGSYICSKGFEDNLGFLDYSLSVHCNKGTTPGRIGNNTTHINLTNTQAVMITDDLIEIIE